MLLIYQKANKHKEFSKNLILEKEERNIYINSKAGYLAFWVSYWYIVIASEGLSVKVKQTYV